MIKPNELRIGNWIISGSNGVFDNEGCIGKVLSIGSEESEFEQIYCECEESFEWFFRNNYFGIPLTEVWLANLGFTKRGNFFMKDAFNEDLEIIFTIKEVRELFTNKLICYTYVNSIIPVKHVHQLQNLYFSLTGEELEIKKT
jgi:hypothetical protein